MWLHSLKVAQLLRSAACLHTNQSRSYLNHLVYAEDVNMLGGNERTLKKNTEDLVVVINEIGPEVNTDKTKYVFMSRDQNTG